MKTTVQLLVSAALFINSTSGLAATLYVDATSQNALPPYTNWATAASTIQDAVDAAAEGDQVLVTNGVYSTGGHDGNRVTIKGAVTLQSMSGPQFTILDGGHSVRCLYLAAGAVLSGFTLQNGVAADGAGAWCESASAWIENCTLSGNAAGHLVGGPMAEPSIIAA